MLAPSMRHGNDATVLVQSGIGRSAADHDAKIAEEHPIKRLAIATQELACGRIFVVVVFAAVCTVSEIAQRAFGAFLIEPPSGTDMACAQRVNYQLDARKDCAMIDLPESGNGPIAPLVRQIHERALGILRYRLEEHEHDALPHERNQLPQATILCTARRGCGDEFHSFISLCVSHTKASAVRIRAIAGAVIGTGLVLGAGGKSRPVE